MSQNTSASAPPLPAGPSRSASMRWQIVGLLMAFSFMTWFNRISMAVAYDERLKDQTDISPDEIGAVYSAFLFAYMVCMTPGGWLIDRFGAWAALAVMGFGSALFGVLTGLAPLSVLVTAGLLLPTLLVIRSLMGVLTAPIYPAASRAVAQWVPISQRARANGLVQGSAALGMACTFPVFGALIDRFDWPMSFVISGIVTGLLALAWMLYASNGPTSDPVIGDGEKPKIAAPALTPAAGSIAMHAPWWHLLRHRNLMLLTLSYAAIGYIEYLFFFWMHFYFEDVLEFPKSASRIYAAVLLVAMAVGMVLGGWVADRLRSRLGGRGSVAIVPVVGLCVAAVLLILGLLAQDTVWIVGLLALALAAVGATEAPVWTMAVEVGKRHGGTAAAICNTGGNAGGMLAPIVTPFVSGWLVREFAVTKLASWQWSISLGSAIAVLGAVLWFWITPEQNGDTRP